MSSNPVLTRFDTLAQRVRFILVEPSHPGNVGAAARAIKTMGFGALVLVRPRDVDARVDPQAVAMASGADDVLAATTVAASLDEALSGVQWSLAMTARPREYGPPLRAPRVAAPIAMDAVAGGATVAVVFGNERTGLANHDVERCTAIAHIPANPAYSSLNLSQAVQVMAYELRLAGEALIAQEPGGGGALVAGANEQGGTVPAIGLHAAAAARADEIEGMFEHLTRALVALEFLDPENPKRLMSRLRRLFARSGLEQEEINILRGIAKRILALTSGEKRA